MLKKDSIWVGVLIGLCLPLVLYGFIQLSLEMTGKYIGGRFDENLQLFLIAVNAFFMRHFMVKREQDQIGKGIMGVTLLMVLIHVAFFYS